MNRVLTPTTVENRKEEICDEQLLNRQVLFTKDKENLYIKYEDRLIPIGGRFKQNFLEAGDNIEIIRDTSKEQNQSEVVRLLDDIDINTCELGKFSDTYRWKGTTKLGELHNSQILLPLTKYTKLEEPYNEKAIIGGEILVKLTNNSKNLTDYFQGALTLSSTGSWSLKGAGSTESNVRMCKMKHKDTNDIYYGLKMPTAVARLPETSQEKSIVDTLYEGDETYYETETSEVQTKYQDDYFIGMAGNTVFGAWQSHYDDRNYLALCNNSSGTAVVLKDTGIVPSDETNQNYHWQYCSFPDLMDLRGEKIVDDGTSIYDYVTKGYYLYFKVYWTNSGGNSTSAAVNLAITDIYVCNTSGDYDPLLYPDRIVEHLAADSNWFVFDESLKEITIEVGEATANSYEVKLLRSDMSGQFYLVTSTNQYVQLNTTNMSSGYNSWYYIYLDTLLNALGAKITGSLANYLGKGYFLYLYIYRRTGNTTNYAVRITQVAITNRIMSTAPVNGTSGVVANYGAKNQDWITFNSDLVTNTSGKYATVRTNTQVTFANLLDVISTEKVTSTILNSSNDFVAHFGDFNFITTTIKEHEVEKTRTVPKISQEEVWTDVDYSSYWKDVYLYRSGGTTFTLQNESGSSLSLLQAFQSSEYSYWYYANLDAVIDLAGRITDLDEDDNLTEWYGKGYYIYLKIYRRPGTDYAVRITSIAITDAVLAGEEPSISTSLVLDTKLVDQDWIELNAAIVTDRTGYYYDMKYSTKIVAFSITQKGKKYTIQETGFEDVEVWFNGWKVIPEDLEISEYEDADFEYVVLSDKSNDNDSFAETFYLDMAGAIAKIPTLQETGIDNAPYKLIITGTINRAQLDAIAELVRDPERQIWLDLSGATVATDAEDWNDYIFKGCVSLRGLQVPQGLKRISNCAFLWCTYLRNLDLSASAGTFNFVGAESGWSQAVGVFTSTRIRNLILPASTKFLGQYLIGSSNVRNMIFLHQNQDPVKVTQWSLLMIRAGGSDTDFTLPDNFHWFVTKSWFNGYLKDYCWNAGSGYSSWGNRMTWTAEAWRDPATHLTGNGYWGNGSEAASAGSYTQYTNGQDGWCNLQGWWHLGFVDKIVVYDPDWNNDEWQEFADKYFWSEDLINEVRMQLGREGNIEIKDPLR